MSALYGLKFIAFVFIFFHHLAFPHSFGSIFTTFFFVFAGFITAFNFRKNKFEPNKKNIKKFYINKFIKNYPIYILTLIISIPYIIFKSGFDLTIKDLFTHVFMLQTVIPQGNKIFMFNGLSWFLVDLMIFYLIIPYIYKFFHKVKINNNQKYIVVLIILFLVEIGFSAIFQNFNCEPYSNCWYLLYISPVSRMLNLLIGFVFGLFFERNQEYLKSKLIKLPSFFIIIIEIIALLNIVFRYFLLNIPGSYSLNGTCDIPMSLILILVFGLGAGFISKLLGSKPLVYLGKLSLSCYMLHQLIINYLTLCCFSNPWYNLAFSYKRNLFNAIFILLIVICVSESFQRYILSPMTSYLLSLTDGKLFKNKVVLKIGDKITYITNNISKFFIKISNVVFNIIIIIFVLIIGFILVSNIINNNILFYNFNIIFILGGLILYCIVIYMLYKIVKKIKLNINKMFIILMAIYCLLQIMVIVLLKVNPSWDFGIILNIVSDSLNNKSAISSSIYLYQFQNNVVYAYLLKLLLLPCKIFRISDYLTVAMIINAVILDIGILFIYKSIKMLFDEEKNKLFLLLLFSFQPILLYVPIIYTDTFAFTFVAIVLYLMLYLLNFKAKSKKKTNKDFIISLILGIVLGLGIQIKFTIVILLIAFVIILFFKDDINRNIKNLLLICFMLLFVMFTIKLNINEKFDSSLLNKNQVPITHWIMMGLSNYGNFNTLDYQMTFQSGDYEDKIEFNKKEIVERFKNHYKNHDLISFYTKKTAYMWNDGTYYFPELLRLSAERNILHEFVLVDGKYFSFYVYYSQIKHVFMIVLILLIPFMSKNENNKLLKNFLLTSLIGYFCFFSIWEVSSRYLFHIIPLLLIATFFCLDIIIKKIFDKKVKKS